jgi:hypothetical protein
MIMMNDETVKEILFGGAVGFCAGFVFRYLLKIGYLEFFINKNIYIWFLRKPYFTLIGQLAGLAFVAFRVAVFEGSLLAPWSPLKIDDASFAAHVVKIDVIKNLNWRLNVFGSFFQRRQVRHKNFSFRKRADIFLRENSVVLTGYGFAYLVKECRFVLMMKYIHLKNDSFLAILISPAIEFIRSFPQCQTDLRPIFVRMMIQ